MQLISLVIIGKLTAKYLPDTSLKTDKRLRLMTEILRGILTIKILCWEKSFSTMIEKARR